MSQEVAETNSAPPALRHDGASDITADDIAFPKLKVGQDTHEQVQSGLVKRGEIFTSTSKDDQSPVVLDGPGPSIGDKTPSKQKGVNVFVIGLRKGWSVSREGNLDTYKWDDPDVPEEAWVTYTYLTIIPDHNQILPVSWLLTRSNKQTAAKINQALALAQASAPNPVVAFTVKTRETKNAKGRWFVWDVLPYEGTDEQQEVVDRLRALFGPGSAVAQRPRRASNEPQI